MTKIFRRALFIATLALVPMSITLSAVTRSPARLLDEAQTVYLGNLARRANGVPPLRWNAQLTDAARWFSWDSVENRADPYCGHQDTNGQWPSDRAPLFGYKGGAGAENAFCGYVTPQQAIDGWMNSPGHRANLLDPNSREIGLGYYLRESDGRGYVTQDFGVDAVYPPVIIDNEAITTTTPNVDLYIYNRSTGGGFAGLASATQMQVGNDECFAGSTWEPYTAEKPWALSAGAGWRSVYVQTRDVFSRTLTVSDTIYLGEDVPLDQIGAEQMSTTRDRVTLRGLNTTGLPQVQFSLGWLADDTFDTFKKWWGNGESVADNAAWGGTAYRLFPGDGESFAWVYDTSFIKDVPLVAYFHLKVNDNTSTAEVARISVKGGGTEYGPISLKGTDFNAANQYQEFAIPFTFNSNPNDGFLMFNFWRSGPADVYVDAVSIFTAPQPVADSIEWLVPGGNYRGQAVWVRYTNGTQFSSISDGQTTMPSLSVTPGSITFLTTSDHTPPVQTVSVQRSGCPAFSWQVADDAAWLQTHIMGDSIQLNADVTGLGAGTYSGVLTITASGVASVGPITVPVKLIVAEQLFDLYLPLIKR